MDTCLPECRTTRAFTSSSSPDGMSTGKIPAMPANRPTLNGRSPRVSLPADPVPSTQATSSRPLDGFRLRRRSALSNSTEGCRRNAFRPRNTSCQGRLARLPRKLHPQKTELELDRSIEPVSSGKSPIQPDDEIWSRLANKLPASPPANLKIGFVPTSNGFRMTVNTGHKETEASFFPSSPDILSNPAPQNATPTASGLTLDLKKTSPGRKPERTRRPAPALRRPRLRTDRTIRSTQNAKARSGPNGIEQREFREHRTPNEHS